ncbi:MAG TPA: formate dehydrogenase accessory sulfurtransferase FdhD [Acidimicrobiales bacterium]|nr:formate dehydrogenase accessory sulfurtransferase FdhD [Acidimicrobiales bacterium]
MSTRRTVADARVVAVRGDRRVDIPDTVVTEEPLEIRLAGPGQHPDLVGVTMRTPGHDFELAVGFLLSEGVLASPRVVRSVRYCPLEGMEQDFNVVTVDVAVRVDLEGRRRQFVVNSACGVCGSQSVGDLAARCPTVGPGPAVPADVLVSLPDRLRREQKVFDRTGGLHGAGLFAADGTLLAVREDVGRHNAVDKLVGWAALGGRLPLGDAVLAVSGRVSYEIVAKAAAAGIPVLVAVSAPSSLAVSTAAAMGITLAGFVRGDRANLYTHPQRVTRPLRPSGRATE